MRALHGNDQAAKLRDEKINEVHQTLLEEPTEERRERIGTIQDRYERSSRNVATQLDEARQEGDLIKVTCINDKLQKGAQP